jgi:hypothetical protein
MFPVRAKITPRGGGGRGDAGSRVADKSVADWGIALQCSLQSMNKEIKKNEAIAKKNPRIYAASTLKRNERAKTLWRE